MVSRNVADGIDIPRARHSEMQTWDTTEIVHFLATVKSSQYYALFYTALFTGCRRSELLGLRWQDIDFIYNRLYINRSLHQLKGGKFVFTQPISASSSRTIALPASAISVLKDYRDNQGMQCDSLGITLTDDRLVLCQYDGRLLRPNTIRRDWATQIQQSGLKMIRFHDARHTHASPMLNQDIHPKVVQERPGHFTIATTLDIYSYVSPGLQEAAVQSFDEAMVDSYNETANNTVH